MKGKNLGDILLEQGVINQETLQKALTLQHRRLGEVLIEENLADPVVIASALKQQALQNASRPKQISFELTDIEELLSILGDLTLDAANPKKAKNLVQSAFKILESNLVRPVQGLLSKSNLVANHVASLTQKKIQFESQGGDLWVDGTLFDDLSDILIHLIRNAVDHGIELPKVRTSLGKPEYGTVRVDLKISKGSLLVEVSDDGAGVDIETVYLLGVEKGLLNQKREDLSKEQILRLLFTPGFSTLRQQSGFSGRGVGLDVVEANVLRMGGNVEVCTDFGHSTKFALQIPLRYSQRSVVSLKAGSNWIAVDSTLIENVDTKKSMDLVSTESPESVSSINVSSAGRLFGEVGGDPQIIVRFINKDLWAFEEIGVPERVLARDVSLLNSTTKGIEGFVRLASGQEVFLVGLEMFSAIVANS